MVLAVADVYCALAEPRAYKPALSRRAILEVMTPLRGSKLDPPAFDALRVVLGLEGGTTGDHVIINSDR